MASTSHARDDSVHDYAVFVGTFTAEFKAADGGTPRATGRRSSAPQAAL